MIVNLIIGLLLVLAFAIFGVYASLAIRHAIRFRSISKRSVYLTLGFLALSAGLIGSSLLIYATLFFN